MLARRRSGPWPRYASLLALVGVLRGRVYSVSGHETRSLHLASSHGNRGGQRCRGADASQDHNSPLTRYRTGCIEMHVRPCQHHVCCRKCEIAPCALRMTFRRRFYARGGHVGTVMRSLRVHGDYGISSDVRAGAPVGLSLEGREPRTQPYGRVGATDVFESPGRVNVCKCVSTCPTADPSPVPFYARHSS